MKFINDRWEFGDRISFGFNYSKADAWRGRYALVLPVWFPFYGRYLSPEHKSEYLSVVIPVIGICLERFSLPWRFFFRSWRWELKRLRRLVSIVDLLETFKFYTTDRNCASGNAAADNLRVITQVFKELSLRGLSPAKIESLLRGEIDGKDRLEVR